MHKDEYYRVQTDPGKPGKCWLLEKFQGKSGKLREYFLKMSITQGNSGNFIFQIPYSRIAYILGSDVPNFQKFFPFGAIQGGPSGRSYIIQMSI